AKRFLVVGDQAHCQCPDCGSGFGSKCKWEKLLLWVKSSPADDVVYTAEDPQKADRIAAAPRTENVVESRMGAVAWGLRPTLRFPSPLIKPSVPISGTRLSDWLHHKTHDGRPLYAGV